MHYRPVIDQVIQQHPLDPLMAIAFVAVFIIIALLTARRPVYGLCALIVAVPFAFYRDALGTTITLPKIVLLGALLGLTTYKGAFAFLRERIAMRFIIAGALVLAATALSIAQATTLAPAIRETLKVVEYLAVFVTGYLCYRLDPDITLVQRAIAITVGLVSFAALLQEIIGAPSALHFNGTIIPRIAGPLEGPNQLAGFLEISIPLLAALLCISRSHPELTAAESSDNRSRDNRRLISAALTLAIFADILTFSRSGLVASVLAIIVVVSTYGRGALVIVRPIAIGAILGATIALFWAIVPHLLGIFRIPPAEMTNYAGGVGTRSELWWGAFELWRQHPWFGVGAGNFELDLSRVGLFGIRTHANSLYLQALVEGGLPLFAAVVYLLYTSIASFIPAIPRLRFASLGMTSANVSGAFVVAALAASVASAFHQVFDLLVFYPKVGEWWWLTLALGAASFGSIFKKSASRSSFKQRPSNVIR